MAKRAVHGSGSMEALQLVLEGNAKRDSVVSADVLDAWYPPSPTVLQKISENLEFLIASSPPTYSEGLKETIALHRGIESKNILVGSGSSSLMFLAIPHLLKSTDRALVPEPMYGEYRHLCEHVIGCGVKDFEIELDSMRIDIDRLANDAAGCRVIFLVNPNSPTGQVLSADQIEALLDILPTETMLWVDETYIDFFSSEQGVNQSVERLVERFENLIVSKSLSKFYALSGLRAGYLAANRNLIQELEQFSPPWSVGTLATVAVDAAMEDADNYYLNRALETRDLREELTRALLERRIVEKVFSESSNFVLCRLTGGFAGELVSHLQNMGIYIRDCASLSPRFANDTVRISVLTRDANRKVVAAIRDYSFSN